MLATTSFLAGTEKTTYQIVHIFVQDQAQGYVDATIWLGAYRSDRAAHAVRLIQFRKGNRTFSYITNVLRLYSRIQPDVPHICIVDITPLPPDLTLLRTARYAHRNPHPRTADYTPLFTNQLLI